MQNARDGVIRFVSILTGGLLLLFTCSYAKGAESPTGSGRMNTGWDLEALKRRGIISEQLDNIDKLNEIPHGMNLVDISLNGNFIGSFQVLVNDRGSVCFNTETFEFIGLTPPEASGKSACYDWISEQPDASIAWQSETQTLSIVVPQAWLLQQENLTAESGGAGAHVNYNYFSNISTYNARTQRYSWLSLYSGINISNWMLRSQQNIEDDKGKVSATVNSTYLERFFSGVNRVVQVGEIYTQNTLFALSALKGIQLFPDDMRSSPTHGSGITVDGIANTPQARVEIRQYNQLIYSTLVPAGPFHLVDIPVQNSNSELHVSVVETSGETQQFVVPVTQLTSSTPSAVRGYSVALGKMENYSGYGNVPAILTMNHNWRPLKAWSLRTGVLLSGNYQSVVAAVSGSPLSMTGQSFHLQAMLVQNRYQHNQSVELRATSYHELTRNVSLSLGINKKTSEFVTLGEAQSRNHYQSVRYGNNDNLELSVGLGWTTEWLGTLSVTHNQTTQYNGEGKWRYYMLNWNRRFHKGLQLTASASRSTGKRSNNSVNINFSWPLGEKRFRHYYRAYNQRSLLGSDVSMPVSSSSQLQLTLEEERSEQERSLQASLSNNLRYTNVNFNMLMDNRHYRNYSLSGNGSIVAHSQGITFSNNPVQDTYGVVALSRPLAGIPVNTPSGTTWTDWRGMAVIPSLTPWRDNAIDIDVDRLPKNADVTNGHRTLRPARGSVRKVSIAMLTGTRLLLTLSLADGKLLPKGSTVWSGQKIVAEAVDDGVVFITNAASEDQLHIKIAHSTEECDIQYQLPEENDPESLYQQLALTCK